MLGDTVVENIDLTRVNSSLIFCKEGENRCRWKEKFEDTKGVIRICKYTREILKG